MTLRAGEHAELHAGDTDAAGRAVHEEVLAGAEPALREQRVVRSGEDLGEAAGLGPRDAVGDAERGALVHERELGLTAAADDGHHPVADGEVLDSRAGGHDLAGELEAGDVGGGVGRRGVEAPPLDHVGAVEARGLHRDQELTRSRAPDRDAPASAGRRRSR